MSTSLREKLGEVYRPMVESDNDRACEKIRIALAQIPRMMADTLENNLKFSDEKPWWPFVFIGNHAVGKIALEILQQQFSQENIGFKSGGDNRPEGEWWLVNMEEMHAASDRVKAEDAIKRCNECGAPAVEFVKAWSIGEEDTFWCEEHSTGLGEKIEKTSSSKQAT